MDIRYINLVFNSLDDLLAEEPDVERFYPLNPSNDVEIPTHLLSQIAARDEIIKKINQSGRLKYNGTDCLLINQFDILDVEELKDAAKYYCLYKIYFNLNDQSEDIYKEKANDYLGKYQQAFKIFHNGKLTIDSDNDGVGDNADAFPNDASETIDTESYGVGNNADAFPN